MFIEKGINMNANKTLYLIIGILTGAICILLVQHNTFAANPGPTESITADGYIAIGAYSKIGSNITWLFDTRNKKVLIYEYVNENGIKLKGARDIQYDIDLPSGTAFPWGYSAADPTPEEVKALYKSFKPK